MIDSAAFHPWRFEGRVANGYKDQYKQNCYFKLSSAARNRLSPLIRTAVPFVMVWLAGPNAVQ